MSVRWKINKPEGLKTFCIGLFGLDKKVGNPDETIDILMAKAPDKVLAECGHISLEPKAA